MGTRCDPATSIDIVREIGSITKDPLIPPENRERHELTTSAALIMACKPYHWIKDFPPVIKSSPELLERTKAKWAKLLE